MDTLQRLQQIRYQRRTTVAAIQALEQWSTEYLEPGNMVFTNGVELYLQSLKMTTVEELASLETEARVYLLHLQGKL